MTREFSPSSRATMARRSFRGLRRPLSRPVRNPSAGRRPAGIVVDQGLGSWLLVDDEEAVRVADDVFERCVLVARQDGEAIVLSAHLFVLSEGHHDLLLATDLADSVRTATLAVKLERHVVVRKNRLAVELFDLLVDLTDSRLVACLPLLTLIHMASSTPPPRSEQVLGEPWLIERLRLGNGLQGVDDLGALRAFSGWRGARAGRRGTRSIG